MTLYAEGSLDQRDGKSASIGQNVAGDPLPTIAYRTLSLGGAIPPAGDSIELFEAQKLPPLDKGYAWCFLMAAFTVEAMVFGYAFSVGILHQVWVTQLFPDTKDASVLALAATLQAGLPLVIMPLASPVYIRFPRYRLPIQLAALVVVCLGIVCTAFASRPYHIVLSLGVAYGFGGAFLYQPGMALLFDWFDRKRGLAGGIIWSASGIGGAIFPFLTQALLDRYSYRTTLFASGISFAVIVFPACLIIRPRVPHRPTSVLHGATTSLGSEGDQPKKTLLSVMRTWHFWGVLLCIFSLSLGFMIPTIYMPLYATQLGLNDTMGVVFVAIVNISSAVGLVVIGLLSDRLPLHLTIPVVCSGAAMSALLLWGLSSGIPLTVLFLLLFGLLGMGVVAVVPRMVAMLAKGNVHLASHLVAICLGVVGAGQILSGPVATALQTVGWGGAKYAYGEAYFGPLIVYVAGVFSLSALFGFSIKPL